MLFQSRLHVKSACIAPALSYAIYLTEHLNSQMVSATSVISGFYSPRRESSIDPEWTKRVSSAHSNLNPDTDLCIG